MKSAPRVRSVLVALLVALSTLPMFARADDLESTKIDFNRDIRPILAAHCFACHGRDEDARQAGLRLDERAAATAELDSGLKAIVPASRDDSELFRRITAEEYERMPPADEGDRLSDDEIEKLGRWIDAGAPFAEHWGFVPPTRPELPQVRNASWPRNEIDYFILARLEIAGLEPSPEADRYTLARRLSLDLRGLPPTLEEVEQFVNDSSRDAYDRLVDRFLADPAYGERWARIWLDLARYADSKGFGSDQLRTIWRYRDWLIDVLNRNQPFDQFTIDQLAGDLLPEPTFDQLLATAFHRNTMTNTEGGTDDEEYRVAAIKDRVDTTGQVWLGLTFGCAKCHDHKFDPLSQREYYQLFAIFNQSADNDQPNESPTIPAPTSAMRAETARIDAQIAPLRKELDTPTLRLAFEQAAWEKLLRDRSGWAPLARTTLDPKLLAIVDMPLAERTADQRNALAAYYRSIAPALGSVRGKIAALEASKPQVPTLPIMRELPREERRMTYVLTKGNFLAPGDQVGPAVPSAFGELPDDAPVNRLALARWIVAPANPLTARVAVNRYWAALFGSGIVETQEDFGIQGSPPSHPELLDHLAVEFVENGWDVKRLLRSIVTSATYRQTSRVTPERLERDPRNRLLSRAPRLRLEAEMVRDQALALAGLLSHKLGGPSVYPPQPEGLWRAAFNQSDRNWPTSEGEDRYRRGLYTFWRRTIPYPSMATFDAPSREICTVRRSRTSTPLQALVTLNDPVFVEAAQALARRVVSEGGATFDERVSFALRLCLARPPVEAQIEALRTLFESELDYYRWHPDEAIKMTTKPLGPLPEGANPADLAAWTVVANVLLNQDAVLTKG